jgi:mannitol-1-/sugar-/sorbitol-6-phosphatase
MPGQNAPGQTAPGQIVLTGIGDFDAVLFDNDGVLVNSMAQVDWAWGAVCDRHGLDRDAVFAVLHGRPARETLSEFVPADRLDAVNDELLALEMDPSVHVPAMNGAIEFIGALMDSGLRWAVATSATAPLAASRMGSAGIPTPPVLVTADQVRAGKPAPDPYLLAASRLGVDPARCVVIEDAPSGVAAGRSAGATVIAVRTTHTDSELLGAAHIVDDLAALHSLLVVP